MKKICIIGVGNMGRAMLDILSSKKLYNVVGCELGEDPNEKARDADVIILSVKPQTFKELSESIKIDLSEKLIISIMAGISSDRIKNSLKMSKIVRVMPNLALKVGKAFSGWYADITVNEEDKGVVREILQSFGGETEVQSEDKINQITALSGSGPAYFYYLAELLEQAATNYGFSKEEAGKIAKTTLVGSAELLAELREEPKEMRTKITSKGGTTEAALHSLQNKNFDKIFLEGIEAARLRAEELNQ